MEFNGEETQRLYEQFTSAPPSAAAASFGPYTCAFCGKSSTAKLTACSRCRRAAYFGKERQVSAWKAHKAKCSPVEG